MPLVIALLCGPARAQKPPAKQGASWDSNAIKAVFDGMLIDDAKHLRFFYVLKNTTGTDYRLGDASNADLMIKTQRNGQAPLAPSEGKFKTDLPILVPARNQRILMITDISHTYDFKEKLPMHATPEQQREYEKKLEVYVRGQWPDMDGFALLDKTARYRIDLPPHW